ncbi:MAG: hypothetical protein ACD_29C00260G0002 [uncultured bacterium]|nr:MAG: hypothetical protein ACD_29C00260G0002 [uncultured bacterium]OGT39469.1 MAG: type II secretion system protein GspJ [Gammaproteobacteria bacterium RIFCSPHIGHO2_12_FULL_38_14]
MFKINIKNNIGFTLIEILIALMIFAIIGVMAALSLHSMIRTNNALKASDRRLMQLQIMMTLLRRDISQMIDRPILDADSTKEPAMTAPGDTEIQFTRTGMVNPFAVNRESNMQRIGYFQEGDKFVRLTWNVLDRAPFTKPEKQVLLNNVQSVSWQMIAGDGHMTRIWPPAINSIMEKQSDNSPLPLAVLMVIHAEKLGVIQGVFPVPARGIYAHASQK